jgi:hypothetical protein
MKSFAITIVEAPEAALACDMQGPRAASSNALM